MIDNLKERIADLNDYASRGTNSRCYLIDDFALLYGSIELDTVEYRKQLIDKYITEGISIAPILEYQVDTSAEKRQYSNGSTYQNGWILQQKAKGKELYNVWSIYSDINSAPNIIDQYYEYLSKVGEYSIIIKQIADIPQEQLDKFIKDYAFLMKSSLIVDPSKPTNFFYDKEEGFTFIDLNLKDQNMNKDFESDMWLVNYVILLLTPVVPTIKIYQEGYKRHGVCEYGTVVLPSDTLTDIKNSLTTIIIKLRQTFLVNNISEEIIKEEIDKRLKRFENINEENNIKIDEKVALNIIATRLNKIMVENFEKGVISDKQHEENHHGIKIN